MLTITFLCYLIFVATPKGGVVECRCDAIGIELSKEGDSSGKETTSSTY